MGIFLVGYYLLHFLIIKDYLDQNIIEIIQFIPTDKLQYKLYSYSPVASDELLSISEYILENISGPVVSCKRRYANYADMLENETFYSFVIRDGEIGLD